VSLPGNLLRAFEANDPTLVPVFVAHAWKERLQAEQSRSRREAAEAEQQRLEAAFHGALGLDADADGDLALEFGRTVDRSLKACLCFLHLKAQPMPDGRSWFRLEMADGPPDSGEGGTEAGGWMDTVQVIAVASRCQAQAITEAVHEVLEARGCHARDDQGLFHLEGPQLASLVAIMKRLALPQTEAARTLAL
jgi:hypothetical protein